jgi:hypothetical protein
VVSTDLKGEGARQILGAWRYVGATLDGQPRPGRGSHAKGMIYYGPHGEMACHVMPDKERTKAGAKPTLEEAFNALDEYIGYFGTYSVDETARIVTHQRHGSVQPSDMHDLQRHFRVEGDRLILNPPGTTYFVTWERFK